MLLCASLLSLHATTAAAALQPYLTNPCANPASPASKMPWCNPQLPLEARIDDMVGRMNLTEKIGAMEEKSAPIDSLDLAYYHWWSEAEHGVASDPYGARNTKDTPAQSNFPFPILTTMAFNRSLWKAIGSQIGREARAFANQGNAYSTFWVSCSLSLTLKRH